jgi:hypothetical protein
VIHVELSFLLNRLSPYRGDSRGVTCTGLVVINEKDNSYQCEEQHERNKSLKSVFPELGFNGRNNFAFLRRLVCSRGKLKICLKKQCLRQVVFVTAAGFQGEKPLVDRTM